MKKNLLVTLANENYIDQAKQLFSSVYFNTGWKGDYMLLAYEVPDEKLEWFRKKGILIKKCRPLHKGRFGTSMHPVVTSKFFLFTPEFKKWRAIIYLDADIIVRASLDKLTKVTEFSAGFEATSMKLKQHFVRVKSPENDKLLEKLAIHYDVQSDAFNSGVMVFNSDIITEDSFDELLRLSKEYPGVNGDQRIFNLFFYKKWKKLPPVFNFLTFNEKNQSHIEAKKVNTIVLHFVNVDKPWIKKNYFFKEWKSNLDKAEEIDLSLIPRGKKWSSLKIKLISAYIDIRKFYFNPFKRRILPKIKRAIQSK